MDDNLGTTDKRRSKGVRARDSPNFRPFIIRHFPQPKSHDPRSHADRHDPSTARMINNRNPFAGCTTYFT
jgi:hypothetical protein